jgi:hypothetical protein
VTDLVYAGQTFNRDSLDVIYAFAQETNTPFDWWFCLGYGESGLDDQETRGDGGRSRGVFQVYTPLHGLPPHGWLGPEGTRAAMEYLWQDRWWRFWRLAGGEDAWLTWTGQAPVASYFLTQPVEYQGKVVPPEAGVPVIGRAAALYWWWPHFQGSTRPTWERACAVEAMGTAIALYYLETRPARDPNPHLVGALDIARSEIDRVIAALTALKAGIDAVL